MRNALLMALHRHRLSSSRSSSSCSSNGVAVLLQYRMAESPLLSQILRLYSCHLDQKEAGHSKECPASFFVYLQDLNLRHEAPNAQHLAETVRGTVSQRVPYISVLDYAFLPVEQPECPASFFVYLQDLNLRHEAPNAKRLAETVRGTVSQQVPYISVLDYSFLPVEQHFFSGVAVLIAVLGNARYKKAGQF